MCSSLWTNHPIIFFYTCFYVGENRMIPPAPEALQRFDLVIRVYGGLLDKITKQPLLRADARLAAKRLRSHIAAGCLSDPKSVSLYFQEGKDSVTGFPLYRCVRGTNDLEGYHLHMRLIAAWCISPRLANLLLLEHNYRWNLRQAVKNRGLDASVGGFYEQPVLEAIQVRYKVCIPSSLRLWSGIHRSASADVKLHTKDKTSSRMPGAHFALVRE